MPTIAVETSSLRRILELVEVGGVNAVALESSQRHVADLATHNKAQDEELATLRKRMDGALDALLWARGFLDGTLSSKPTERHALLAQIEKVLGPGWRR